MYGKFRIYCSMFSLNRIEQRIGKGTDMSLTLIGRKIGMTQVFDKDGNSVVCTIIQAEPNTVLQVKKATTNNQIGTKDGYNAIQLCGLPVKKTQGGRHRLTKPLLERYKQLNIEPCSEVRESRPNSDTKHRDFFDVNDYQVGQQIDLSYFADVKLVDIEGVSKGKGFQGVMKLHNFAGAGSASHGHSITHRHAGATGQRTTPGRVFPGHPMASRMGGDVQTTHNLRVFKVDGNILLVEGAVPGARNGVVFVRKAIKARKR